MPSHLIQNSFCGGEWSPLLEGRNDLDKYATALHLMENFIVDPHGPAVFRPGFRFIKPTKDSSKQSRLVSFQFSTEQAYILEFGDYYIRFYRDRAQVMNGVVVYEIATPYPEADIFDIEARCQSADVLYILHPSYAPRKLSRAGHTAWTLSTINFRPPAISEQGSKPDAALTLAATTGTGIAFTASAAAFLSGDVGRTITSGIGRASITAFNSSTVVECEIIDDFAAVGPIASQSWSMRGSPNGNLKPDIMSPIGSIATLTATELIDDFVDLLGEDEDYWAISALGTNEFYLKNSAPGYIATTPGTVLVNGAVIAVAPIGTLGPNQWAFGDNDTLGYDTIYIRLTSEDDPDGKSTALDPRNDYVKRATVAASAEFFRASDVGKYVRVHSGMVKIGTVVSAGEVRGEILKELTSDVSTTNWTIESDVWTASNGYPSCATFYGDRLCLAGSTAYPETIWGSVVGDYENFTPGVDDSDAFEFTLGGNQVKKILWMEEKEALIVGTPNGPYRIGPEDTSTPITPLNVMGKRRGTKGCADIAPITINESTLYIQKAGKYLDRGNKVREFTYQWESNGYLAPDLTLLAEHMTKYGLVGIVFQEEPFSTIWGWDTEGQLMACTYLRDQDVVGWHRHPMTGTVESMAVIPGAKGDEVWAIINRAINGATTRYVEILETPFNDTITEYAANKGLNAFFVDSGITYNGAAATTITGLGHLEGQTVAVLADGSSVSLKVVAGGQITLNTAASVVHVGLPYTGKLHTMRVNAAMGDGSSQAKTKKIHDITIRVHQSGVFKAGRDENNLDACFDKERVLTMGGAYPLFTGDIPIGFDGKWEKDGRVMIVQDKPMPLAVVALMAEVSING